MKKRFRALAALLALTLFSLPAASAAAPSADQHMRGAWVATVYDIDYPARATTSADALKSQADAMLDQAKSMGLNAIFFQVRPTSDALYPSDIFPWSHWLTGTQGAAPDSGFDPLAYWVEGAHARGLELHAWINPYRVTRDKNWDALSPSNPAKQNPGWVIKYTDGNYYYNPALPEVRELVVKGAEEIVRKYDVDGIHLDDYFYPGEDFDDAAAYAAYGAGFSSLADWRRDNVNQLVALLDKRLHAIDPELSFGISPAGVWANKSTDPRGSDTRGGNESYARAYADSLAWIEAGTIDYIIPQIYWEIGHKLADFSTLTEWWRNAVEGSDVKLYIGLAAYRCDTSESGAWTVADPVAHIINQLDYVAERPDVAGEVYFSFSSLTDVAGFADRVTAWNNANVPQAVPDTAPENALPGKDLPRKVSDWAAVLSLFLSALVR